MQWKAFIVNATLIGLSTALPVFLFPNPRPITGGTPIAKFQSLVFSPATVPNGQYGSSYKSLDLKVSGGKAPYTFSITKGSLPPGLSLSTDGTISGTPTAAGRYPFSVTAVDHSKDVITGSQDYTLTIDQATLTVTANSASMTYGGSLPALTVSYSGFVNGENAASLTTRPTVTTAATSSSAAGTYTITASGATDPNYTIYYNSGILTINPAPLSVVANAQTKPFGAADPPLTYTSSGFVNGDNSGIITGSLSRAPGENVGSYSITQGSLSAGRNYTIGFTGNYLTITGGSQHITWTQSLLIGCNGTTQIQLTAAASSGLPVTYSVSDTRIATVSGNILTVLQPGTAIITATQPGNANISAAQPVTDTLRYEPASLISQHWDDVLFFDNSSGDYVQWQWYKNGQAVPGATNPYYSETPSLNGQYYVVATNAAGKQIQSCTLSVTAGAAVPGGIRVHPNPAGPGEIVTVTSNYSGTALKGATLQMVDINGKVWLRKSDVQASMLMSMPSGPGIYIINLLLASGQRVSTNVLVEN